MTLDLDELERKAKAACSDVVGPLECTDIGMERTADLEFIDAVRAAGGGWKPRAMYGAPLVLALIERVRVMTDTANARFRDMQDAEDREKDQRHRAEAAEKRVRALEARWRAAWCIHFGRVVNADNPRDCVTLKDPDPCDKCQQWLKEHST